jgi:hypothetical protein
MCFLFSILALADKTLRRRGNGGKVNETLIKSEERKGGERERMRRRRRRGVFIRKASSQQ